MLDSEDRRLNTGALREEKDKVSGNSNEMDLGGDVIQQSLVCGANSDHVGSLRETPSRKASRIPLQKEESPQNGEDAGTFITES